MHLSSNFTLDELTVSQTAARNGWDNTPNASEIANLTRLAGLLEQVSNFIGRPITINSGFRSKLVNDAVGSRDSSQHRIGCAADIRVTNMTPDQICETIKASGIQFDQLIREFDSWVHISVTNNPSDTPRNQMLIIDRAGTRPYA
jgi:uncharacterized protein YcbK (DUF882 family)